MQHIGFGGQHFGVGQHIGAGIHFGGQQFDGGQQILFTGGQYSLGFGIIQHSIDFFGGQGSGLQESLQLSSQKPDSLILYLILLSQHRYNFFSYLYMLANLNNKEKKKLKMRKNLSKDKKKLLFLKLRNKKVRQGDMKEN